MRPPSHNYHHARLRNFFSFTVPPGKDVLLVGYDDDADLDATKPRRGVAVCANDVKIGASRYPLFEISDIRSITGTFDYIIFKNYLGSCTDIGSFLQQLRDLCHPATRIINCTYNFLWRPALVAGERMGLKRPGGARSWLSERDVINAMTAAGFGLVSSSHQNLLPIRAAGLGPAINEIGRYGAWLDWLKLDQFQIFRVRTCGPEQPESVTICLTCRDERENIEPIVQAIPQVASRQEILFVEGHSRDGTREEIERVIRAYPSRDIRVIGQPGSGQGDAIRTGFHAARGEIVILLEADQTSPPENIAYFYNTIHRRHADFIEGSRFVYPISRQSMPLVNQVGNWVFAFFMSWLLGRQMTDVLSGIKAIRKTDFLDIERRWNQWGIDDPFGDFELLFGAARMGLLTAEQPIHYQPRPYGETKTRVLSHGLLLTRMAWTALRKFRG